MAGKADVAKVALALGGVTQVDHWGRPSWRTKKRIFAVLRPDGLYLNLDEERKEFLFEADPKTFVKYMWGKTAHVIVQIDRIGKLALQALIEEAWRKNSAPPKAKKASAKRPAAPRRKRART